MAGNKEWKWGYITPQGDFAISPVFDAAADFCEGLAAVKTGWARGYIGRDGRFEIPPVFEAAGDFCDGRATVSIDGETRLIDTTGKIIECAVPQAAPQFESGYNPRFELHDGLMRFVENLKYGYKDSDGRIVVPARYFDARDFSEGLACVKKTKSSDWCYIDTAGHAPTRACFRQARDFHERLAAVLVATDVNT